MLTPLLVWLSFVQLDKQKQVTMHELSLSQLTALAREAFPEALAGGEQIVFTSQWTSGKEYTVTEANVGDLLLDVADSVGIHIPRGCKSGLCGSCTCDLKDPEWSAAAQSVTVSLAVARWCWSTVSGAGSELEWHTSLPVQEQRTRWRAGWW